MSVLLSAHVQRCSIPLWIFIKFGSREFYLNNVDMLEFWLKPVKKYGEIYM
jgi:hypothetical protein